MIFFLAPEKYLKHTSNLVREVFAINYMHM